MKDLFESHKLLVADARRRIQELETLIQEFIDRKPYERVIDTDPETGHHVHKIRLREAIPTAFTLPVFHTMNDLRSALDHAVHASVAALSDVDSSNACFPFRKNSIELEAALNDRRGGFRDIDPEIKSLLASFKPYYGGDDDLRALNDIRNRKIHRYLIPALIKGFGVITGGTPTSVRRGRGSIDQTWDFGPTGITIGAPVFDREKNEITIASAPPALDGHYNVEVTLEITFDEDVAVLGGKPLVSALKALADKIEGICSSIEHAALRISRAKAA